jgi:hypothetical protein
LAGLTWLVKLPVAGLIWLVKIPVAGLIWLMKWSLLARINFWRLPYRQNSTITYNSPGNILIDQLTNNTRAKIVEGAANVCLILTEMDVAGDSP